MIKSLSCWPAGLLLVASPSFGQEPVALELAGSWLLEGAEAAPDGSFTLHYTLEGLPRRRLVSVRQGRFELKLSSDGALELGDLRLGGKAARATGADWPLTPGEARLDAALELRATALKPTRLFVRDATGKELEELEVVTGLPPESARQALPGTTEPIFRMWDQTQSPIVFELPFAVPHGEAVEKCVYVRAPGYSWQRVVVDLASQADEVLELKPEGRLDVSFFGFFDQLQGARGTVHLEPLDPPGPVLTRPLGAQGLVSFEGIPHGRYRAVPDIKNFSFVPAAQEVVVAGARSLLFEGRKGAPDPRRPIEGTIHLSKAWKIKPFQVRITRWRPSGPGRPPTEQQRTVRRVKALDPSAGLYAWDTFELEPGAYRMWVDPLNYVQEFVVPRASAEEPEAPWGFDFELPPPTRLRVRVSDAQTGELVEVNTVAWRLFQDSSWTQGASTRILTPNADGVFELVVPAAPVELAVQDGRYAWRPTRVDPVGATTEVMLFVGPALGFDIAFYEGEKLEAWRTGLERTIRIVRLDGPAPLYSVRGYAKKGRVHLAEPGHYLFYVQSTPGFQPLTYQEVWVESGGFSEHAIALERDSRGR